MAWIPTIRHPWPQLLLSIVAPMAGYIPARRAAGFDPAGASRSWWDDVAQTKSVPVTANNPNSLKGEFAAVVRNQSIRWRFAEWEC